MAAARACSVHTSLLRPPRRFVTMGNQFIPKCWFSKMGLNPLQLRSTVPARKLLVRAARTESKGVSLGFRAPDFQLSEPLTGKVWKLEDFESYPALLKLLQEAMNFGIQIAYFVKYKRRNELY